VAGPTFILPVRLGDRMGETESTPPHPHTPQTPGSSSSRSDPGGWIDAAFGSQHRSALGCLRLFVSPDAYDGHLRPTLSFLLSGLLCYYCKRQVYSSDFTIELYNQTLCFLLTRTFRVTSLWKFCRCATIGSCDYPKYCKLHKFTW
jgi:hypothetical protein